MKKDGSPDAKKIKKIKKVDVKDEKSNYFFVGLIALLVVGALGAVLYVASNRESALNVAPEVNKGLPDDDHWHYSYAIANCGEIMQPSSTTDGPVGIHTHGQGLLHIHPNKPEGAGPNAKFSRFVEALGAELTDDTYTPGSGEDPTVLSEAEGCNGEPATLKLAYWEDAYDNDAEPTEIVEENIGDFKMTEPGGMVTLALVADGAEIPRPPADRIARQAETDGVDYTPAEAALPETVEGAEISAAGADTTAGEAAEESAPAETTIG